MFTAGPTAPYASIGIPNMNSVNVTVFTGQNINQSVESYVERYNVTLHYNEEGHVLSMTPTQSITTLRSGYILK